MAISADIIINDCNLAPVLLLRTKAALSLSLVCGALSHLERRRTGALLFHEYPRWTFVAIEEAERLLITSPPIIKS